jgi:PIN domain nuclease of toxin-antitoxin system
MSAVAADTHAALWYLKKAARLSPTALQALESAARKGAPIYLSVISLVEVCYLIEKGKLPHSDWSVVISSISNGVKSAIELAPFDRKIAETLPHIPRSIVPDMPDRIIAATALHLGVPLVSRDRKIQVSSIHTIW